MTFRFIINKCHQGLIFLQKWVLIVASILIMLGICTQAACRYLFQIDFYGLEEVIILVAFWMYFFGGSYGSYERSHITADIVTVYVTNEKLKRILMLISSLITTVICLLFTYWAYGLFIWGIEKMARTPVLEIPMVLSQSSIFAGFILMSLYSTIYLVEDIKEYRHRFKVRSEN